MITRRMKVTKMKFQTVWWQRRRWGFSFLWIYLVIIICIICVRSDVRSFIINYIQFLLPWEIHLWKSHSTLYMKLPKWPIKQHVRFQANTVLLLPSRFSVILWLLWFYNIKSLLPVFFFFLITQKSVFKGLSPNESQVSDESPRNWDSLFRFPYDLEIGSLSNFITGQGGSLMDPDSCLLRLFQSTDVVRT